MTTLETTAPVSARESPAAGPLLTVEETAAVLRIGRNTCYELIRQGQIPHIRLGRLIRVPRHALMFWFGEQAVDMPQHNPGIPSLSQRH